MCAKLLKNVPSNRILLGIVLICTAVWGATYVMQHFFGYLPCQMCLYERNVFIATGAFSLLSLMFLPARFHSYALIALGLIFAGGALLAGYHVAIQQHWVSLPSFCASHDFNALNSVEALREQLLNTPFVRCDQVTWSLGGLSLAAYTALLSLILSLGCWAWVCVQKK